eukprot:c8238_g1_i1 orf=3-230(-)
MQYCEHDLIYSGGCSLLGVSTVKRELLLSLPFEPQSHRDPLHSFLEATLQICTAFQIIASIVNVPTLTKLSPLSLS